MSGVGIAGLLLGLLAALVAFVHPTRARIAVFAFAYLLHVAATVAYYELVKNSGGDAALYYYDPFRIYGSGFGLNTTFIVYIVQAPKSIFGGSYLDYFLVFQAIGFFGIAALMRIFEEIYLEAGTPQPIYIYALLFMPSLHYWTSAIGKDSLFFFAICISLWAAMQYKRRWLALAMGILLMLAIRPHIAAIAVAAFAVTVIIDRNTRLVVKLPLFVASAAGTVFAIAAVWSAFRVDLISIDTVSDVLASREALATSESAGRSAVTGGFVIRLLSLLLRPLFFDANGALGLIVSMENLLLLVILALMVARLRTIIALAKGVAFVRYALVSTVVITLALSIGYYNVGLGIRQKATMILPGILVAFVALQALLRGRREVHQPQEIQGVQPSFG